ncbi:MAG: inositol monophosphatase family protein [Spirochaetota bacterium]
MYRLFRQFAEEIAVHAGDEILLKGFLSGAAEISYKSRTNLVTNMDKASEEYLYDAIRREYPSHAVLAEEGSINVSDSDILWLVDPLDATTNFAHGIAHYCVSVGAFSRSEKRTVAGAVYDPDRKELFSAALGDGAALNGEAVRVSQTDDIGISLLATGFPYDKEDSRINNLSQFTGILPKVQCVRRMGSAALDLCYVASGRLEGYWEPMLYPWDTSAGSLIVEEAGGKASLYKGEPADPFVPEIIASNGRIHCQLIEEIRASTILYPRDAVSRRFF